MRRGTTDAVRTPMRNLAWLAATLAVSGCFGQAGLAPDGGGTDASSDVRAQPDAGGDELAPDADNGDGGLPVACSGTHPSFRNEVSPILQRCGGELCHGGISPDWPYDRLVNVPSTRDDCDAGMIVTPGDLIHSYLIRKITGVGICPDSQRMPSAGDPLPASDIQTIADWVCSGAPND
jgi:hypothetical protein